MISSFFHTAFYTPLYNGLIFLLGFVPGGDVGVAIILFTIFVKLVLFPLSARSITTQRRMRELEPEMKAVQEKYKGDKEEQARATMALYKEKKLNPFSGFFLILIQIPIIIALYQVFIGAGLPKINTELLYSFVHTPILVSMKFFGILNVAERSLILALLAGITQYFQAKYVLPPSAPRSGGEKKEGSFRDEFMRGMNLQMQYFLPVFITFVSWTVSGAVALYWVTNNLFSIAQELYMRKKNLK